MKILHVNTSDCQGGAAIAAMRHCEAMRSSGIDAQFLCLTPQSGNPFSRGVDSFIGMTIFLQRLYNKINSLKTRASAPYATWSNAAYGFDISNHPLVKWADEIWIHWINAGMLSLKSIEKLLKIGKPITWYLHDMWPLTGGCHHSFGCKGFRQLCGNCPLLFNQQGSGNPDDISRLQMLEKQKRWVGHDNLQIIAPSRWLADLAHKSSLFGNDKNKIDVLPNPINTNVFNHLVKDEARKQLNLPQDKPLILFGAYNVNDPYKGMHYLLDALPLLENTNAECIVFGGNSKKLTSDSLPLKIHPIGSVYSSEILCQVYSAADLFVTPSIADNYPNVLIESMACGTPCVGFNIGGIPEIIHDGVSGLIAHDVSAESLADTILRALPHAEEFGTNARKQIIQNNSYENYRQFI